MKNTCENKLKEERVILAHSFRRFSPWSDSISSGLRCCRTSWQKDVAEGSCLLYDSQDGVETTLAASALFHCHSIQAPSHIQGGLPSVCVPRAMSLETSSQTHPEVILTNFLGISQSKLTVKINPNMSFPSKNITHC